MHLATWTHKNVDTVSLFLNYNYNNSPGFSNRISPYYFTLFPPQDEEVGNSNSTTHYFNTRTQVNATDAENVWRREMHQPFTTRYVPDPSSQGHEVQRAVTRDQNQNLPVRAPSQDLPGLIPPREIDFRPPDSEAADGAQNYRRMAVCQETDDAQFQRTRMRVYMKRF